MNDENASPYRVSVNPMVVSLTARGYSERQCFWRFMLIGGVMACLGGPLLILLSKWRVDTWVQLLAPGILFGLALWLAIQWYIGSVSRKRKITLVAGCLFAFVLCGGVYELTIPDDWFRQQPWTWKLMRPYVYAPLVGFAALVVIVRLVSGKVQLNVLLYVWLIGSIMGFTALFTVDELGWRTGRFDVEVLAFLSSAVLQTGMTALIGWQLAAAHTEQQSITTPVENLSAP